MKVIKWLKWHIRGWILAKQIARFERWQEEYKRTEGYQ